MTTIDRAIRLAISGYCAVSPFDRGKARLQKLGLDLIGRSSYEAVSRDGLRFVLQFPGDDGYEPVLFQRTYETGTLDVLRKLICRDNVVFDIGANVGWFTVHAAKFASAGSVHAFEPVPRTFERLQRHCRVNGVSNNTILNNVALTDREGEASIHEFAALGHGHCSMSSLGRIDAIQRTVKATTLDRYLESHAILGCDLVKMDVEGAELGVLIGASKLFNLERPPVWVVEVNPETAESFGYHPMDLIGWIAARGDYTLFRIPRSWEAVRGPISIEDFRPGDNAVCVPRQRLSHWAAVFPRLAA